MKLLYTSILLFTLYSCQNDEVVKFSNQELEYAVVETRPNDSTFQIEAKSPYYKDNLIFNSCYEITYEYKYSKNGETKYTNIEGFKEWNFLSKESINLGKGFKYIRLTSPNPNSANNYEPQSTIKYEYINSKNEVIMTSHTGVVENYQNILIHNPRAGFFIKLFSFPWPSIKFPINNNAKWNWEWNYNSDTFGDDRFFNWTGITKMKYEYNVVGNETINLDLGEIDAWRIEAIGTNGEINNKLTYFFNSKLGFVKQIFETHDGAIIELNAIEYKDKCKSSG